MQDLLELSKSPSIFASQCKVSHGEFSPDIEIDEARCVTIPCFNQFRKNVITCSDDYRHEFVDEVEGIALDTKLSFELDTLPFYIPVFDSKLDVIPNLNDAFPIVALTMKDILSSGVTHRAGCLHEEKSVIMRSAMLKTYCFKNKKVILFSSGSDTLIEYVWRKRVDIDYFSKIKNMGFYAATGFNFSLFEGECPFSHQLNMKRSVFSSHLYEEAGVASIPHIYALTKQQVERWCTWLKGNPSIRYFNVNCQLQNSRVEIDRVIQSVRAILNFVPNVRVILHGFPMDRIGDFHLDILRIHFADSAPHKKARNYRRMIFDENRFKIKCVQDSSVSIAELINHNFLEKLKYLNFAKKQIIERKISA